MAITPELKDKVIIVTGCAGGIGLAVAWEALESGAKVFGVDMAAAPDEINLNINFKYYFTDLTAAEAPARVAKACAEAFNGRIDGLVNNAGVLDKFAAAATVDDDTWDRVLAVNLTAPVKLMRAVIPTMLDQGNGAIVNVSSLAGTSGISAGIAYTCSKHGLIGATKHTAFRYRDQIRCCAVCPANIDTNMVRNFDHSVMDMESLMTTVPIHMKVQESTEQRKFKATPPEEVAHLILFLLSDVNKSVNGAIVPIDQAFSVI